MVSLLNENNSPVLSKNNSNEYQSEYFTKNFKILYWAKCFQLHEQLDGGSTFFSSTSAVAVSRNRRFGAIGLYVCLSKI